ncbi:MAG: hypothetical protein SPK61_06710 [Bacteroidales bacterium]|nr:hypothetical protein [Bacteroidales bacterium]
MKKKRMLKYAVIVIIETTLSVGLLYKFQFLGRPPLGNKELPFVIIISIIVFSAGAFIDWLTSNER